MTIIAFTGPKGCGKSAAASHLIEKYSFRKHPFAKPLKEMIKCLGLTEEHVNGSLKEVPCEELCGKTPRWAMQSIGTQWARNLIHPDLWINAWKNTMPNANIVCDDLRFPNEYDIIKKNDGIVIDIIRPGYERDQSHESESHNIPYDYQIINDRNFEHLFAKIEDLIPAEI